MEESTARESIINETATPIMPGTCSRGMPLAFRIVPEPTATAR